jgi:hypothetical protein
MLIEAGIAAARLRAQQAMDAFISGATGMMRQLSNEAYCSALAIGHAQSRDDEKRLFDQVFACHMAVSGVVEETQAVVASLHEFRGELMELVQSALERMAGAPAEEHNA